jgi:hypothetical protein
MLGKALFALGLLALLALPAMAEDSANYDKSQDDATTTVLDTDTSVVVDPDLTDPALSINVDADGNPVYPTNVMGDTATRRPAMTSGNHPEPMPQSFGPAPSELIASWPQVSQIAAQEFISKYGNPDTWSADMLHWYNAGPWAMVTISAAPVPHNFPLPHQEVIETSVFMDVPDNLVDDLGFMGLKYDKIKGVAQAREESEDQLFLLFNLANDVIAGELTGSQGKQQYAAILLDNQNTGATHPYLTALAFTPLTMAQAANPEAPATAVAGFTGTRGQGIYNMDGQAQGGQMHDGQMRDGQMRDRNMNDRGYKRGTRGYSRDRYWDGCSWGGWHGGWGWHDDDDDMGDSDPEGNSVINTFSDSRTPGTARYATSVVGMEMGDRHYSRGGYWDDCGDWVSTWTGSNRWYGSNYDDNWYADDFQGGRVAGYYGMNPGWRSSTWQLDAAREAEYDAIFGGDWDTANRMRSTYYRGGWNGDEFDSDVNVNMDRDRFNVDSDRFDVNVDRDRLEVDPDRFNVDEDRLQIETDID